MARLFVQTITILLAVVASAHAQTRNPAAAPGSIAGPSGASALGVNPSASQTNPAQSLRGMPCSVSLNATGGLTTSSSCGSDPLEVPARTIVSPDQVNSSQATSAETSGGASATGGTQSSARPSSGTTSGSASTASTTTPTANTANARAGGAPGTSALCATTIPTTSGSTGAGSLVGGC